MWRATSSLSPVTTLRATPCAGELRDRLADAGLGRVAEEDHALEDEVALEPVGVREARRRPGRRTAELVGAEDPRADGDQPEAVGRGLVHELREPVVLGRSIGRAVWSSRTWLARSDHRLRRALRHEERRLGAALDDHAQQPALEVVRQLGELPVGREVGRLRRPGEDRGVERVRRSRSRSGC